MMSQRLKEISVLMGGIFLAVLVNSAHIAEIYRLLPEPPHLTAELSRQIEAQGNAITVALDAYRTEHGQYPEFLDDLGLASDVIQTPYGPFHYSHCANDTYSLTLGDYYRNGFHLRWQGTARGWYWDT